MKFVDKRKDRSFLKVKEKVVHGQKMEDWKNVPIPFKKGHSRRKGVTA